MAIVEVIAFTFNAALIAETDNMKIADIGGSMVIHTFGAYFGLACTLGLHNSKT